MATSKLFIIASIICLSACHRSNSSISVGFQDGGNLQKGDKVLLDGIAVGEVLKFHFVPRMVFVDLSMEEDVKIPLKSQFVISKSFLGSASIIIQPSCDAKFITSTDTVVGVSYKEPVLDSVKQKKAQAAVQKMVEGFAELIQALKDSARNN